MNVIQIYQSISSFTDLIFKKTSKDSSQQFKLELKAFVDGAAQDEPIFTGYLMTFNVTISQIKPSEGAS